MPRRLFSARTLLGCALTVALAACSDSTTGGGGSPDAPNPYLGAGDQSWYDPGRSSDDVRALSLLGAGDNSLSDLDWVSATNGWGPAELDRSNGEQGPRDGRTLTLNGAAFARGLGVHAGSTLTYALEGSCTTFTAQVGVDDEVGDRGSVVFQVYGDGERLYDSGTLTGSSATKSVSVNVSGRRELKLVVTDAGDNNWYDHADWANARVACAPSGAPQGASERTQVSVPASMRSDPFDVPRFLNVPPGFSVSVYSRIPGARFMAVSPSGDLLVSQPGAGKVLLVRPGSAGEGVVTEFASGLKKPHDLVFHTLGGRTYLYVSESNRVTRSVYEPGDATTRTRETVVANLPDGNSSGALRGSYGHELKNIALTGDRLYVSIASASNADPADLDQTPKQGAVYEYSASTPNQQATAGRLFAQGLRNAEGLDFVPGTSDLWVVVNNRDNIAYPHQRDFDGDGTNDYGKVMQAYVDNHPPEEFTRVRDGGNYGWPFCNPNPDAGLNLMPYDRDVQNNADGGRLNCAGIDRINQGIQAHSAPLGLTFLQDTAFPLRYRQGAVVAYHGSWNRSQRTGYKVTYFPWNAGEKDVGDEIDLVTGWIEDGVWGRPVDAVVDLEGHLLISDDILGVVYRLRPNAAASPLAVTSFTLFNADTDRPIPGYDPVSDGAVLNLATLPTRNLSVRANTAAGGVGSVRFSLDGNPDFRVENGAPYTIAGDNGATGDYYPWTPAAGEHRLAATPFSNSGGTGTAGTPKTIRFTVQDGR